MRQHLLAIACATALVPAAKAADLTINIGNIGEPAGAVRWVLYDSEASYSSNSQPLASASNRVDGESIRFTVHDLPAGRYAVKLFHDSNDNGELDANMLGIPSEGYGFSNNAGRFGAPSFEEAAVVLEEDLQIDIRIR